MGRGSIENDSNKLEICMKENLNLLNKNKCVKLYRKKFYNSLKKDDAEQLKCFIKLYNIINRCINKFKYPILKFNFIIDVFFSNNENNIYFKTAIVLDKYLPASNSANTCNIFLIQSSFLYFKQQAFMNSIPLIFLSLMEETNKKRNTRWESARIASVGETTKSTVRTKREETTMDATWSGGITAFTCGTGTSGVTYEFSNIGGTVSPTVCYNNMNGYSGLYFPSGFNGTVTFSNTLFSQFGMAMCGGGGGRGNTSSSAKCGGGGGGCYYNKIFPISEQCDYTISVGFGGSGGTGNAKYDSKDASKGETTTIKTTGKINEISTIIECTGGLPATYDIGVGGTCSDSSYGFGGGNGGLTNTDGQDAIITNTTSNVVGNDDYTIKCYTQTYTIGGGGGGASTQSPCLATSGNGYGGKPIYSNDLTHTQWPDGTIPVCYGGGAGTSSTYKQPSIVNKGIDGALFIWWIKENN